MRHGGARGRGGFRGADIEPAIDHRRIHADDLERYSLAPSAARGRSCRTPSGPVMQTHWSGRLIRSRLLSAQEQAVEIRERDVSPGRTAVIARSLRSVRSISRSSAFISVDVERRCARTAA